MKTDEEIEAERAELEPLIGQTRAGWYAEACDVYPEKDGHEPTLWACRYREMAMEAGRLESAVLAEREACAKLIQNVTIKIADNVIHIGTLLATAIREREETCSVCGGSGGGTDPVLSCKACQGSGRAAT